MIKGIGVDSVKCSRMRKVLEGPASSSFLARTFTDAERAAKRGAPGSEVYITYFAAQFAAKEAVFKAVAQHLPEKTFDLRIVETLRREDGSPYVNRTDALAKVLDRAGIGRVFISITTENDTATAFVVAEDAGAVDLF